MGIVAKTRTTFFCQNCGAQSPKWIGKCPSCGEWNTYVEEIIQPKTETSPWKPAASSRQKAPRAQLLNSISVKDEHRIHITDSELNRVLGGGLVPGSIVLF